MPRDLTDLLHDTAETPSAPLDPEAIRQRVQRRRRTRHATGLAGCLAAVALAALLVGGLQDDPDGIDFIDQPTPAPAEPEPQPDTEPAENPDEEPVGEPAEGDRGPEWHPDALGDLPAEGVAIQVDDVTVFVGLDGTVHGHIARTLSGGGPANPYNSVVLLRSGGDVQRWLDPTELRIQSTLGLPVAHGGRVAPAAGGQRELLFGQESGLEPLTWPADAPWWVSDRGRVVTWATCADGDCPHEFYDLDMGGRGELDPGCWVAHTLGDFAQTRVCDDGGRLESYEPTAPVSIEVPEGADGQPGAATAVFDQGVVRVDHASCDIVEPFRLEGDELVPLLGPDRSGNPSAVPLGVTPDGRVVLHFNRAACDATARQPGIHLLDPGTGELTLVWEGPAPADGARMWQPNPAILGPPSQSAEDAARDGVVPELAALPLRIRAAVFDDVEADEGRWALSRPGPEMRARTQGCGLGNLADGVYGQDVICDMEYGEVLLLDPSGDILRAYPLPGLPPQWLEITDDAVYCGRQGDGSLGDSMLCRIDRATGEWIVRVFPRRLIVPEYPHSLDTGFADPSTYVPEHWIIDESADAVFSEATVTDGALVIEGWAGSSRVDPDTLELLDRPAE